MACYFFPKNPQKKGKVYQASMQAASSETMGVQEFPFLTPHNKSLLHAHVYSNLKRVIMCVVPPQTQLPLDTHIDKGNRLNDQIQSPVGKVSLPANKG